MFLQLFLDLDTTRPPNYMLSPELCTHEDHISFPDQGDLLPPRPLSFSLWLLLSKDLLKPCLHVNFHRWIGPLIVPRPDSMSNIEDQKHWNAHIRSEEAAHIPFLWKEDIESVDK